MGKTKKKVETSKRTRGSSKNLWASRQRNLADMPNARGMVNLSKEEVGPSAHWGHSGYFLEPLNYLYNVNDSQMWSIEQLADGFHKGGWENKVRVLKDREDSLNDSGSTDVGEGLCYLLSYCIAKLVNKAFKVGGQKTVDKLNKFLITCTREQLFNKYEAL